MAITQENVWSEKKKIYHMLQALILESRMLYKQHIQDSMTKFIQQRYQNYQDNPKAMLDSLLNWSKRVIRLDYLVVKDHHNDHLLIIDPDTIKQTDLHICPKTIQLNGLNGSWNMLLEITLIFQFIINFLIFPPYQNG